MSNEEIKSYIEEITEQINQIENSLERTGKYSGKELSCEILRRLGGSLEDAESARNYSGIVYPSRPTKGFTDALWISMDLAKDAYAALLKEINDGLVEEISMGNIVMKILDNFQRELELAEKGKLRCKEKNTMQYEPAKGYVDGMKHSMDLVKDAYVHMLKENKEMTAKQKMIEYMRNSVSTNAHNSMGCSENYYNPFYSVMDTFTEDEIMDMDDAEIGHLLKLADNIAEGLY